MPHLEHHIDASGLSYIYSISTGHRSAKPLSFHADCIGSGWERRSNVISRTVRLKLRDNAGLLACDGQLRHRNSRPARIQDGPEESPGYGLSKGDRG